jgi:AcrR family transcriptional regulator
MTTQARQSTELRQAEIIATMLRLAAERNPADITTTDIAKAMRVTQGALFRHFATKEAIRLAVVEWIEAQLLGALLAARQAAPDALAALRTMFLAHVRFAQAYPGVPRLIFAELQQAEASPVRLVVQKSCSAIGRCWRKRLPWPWPRNGFVPMSIARPPHHSSWAAYRGWSYSRC